MAKNPATGQRHPLPGTRDPLAGTRGIDERDEGQVIGPDGESPEDPAAKALTRGCMIMLLVLGIFIGLSSLLYWLYIAA